MGAELSRESSAYRITLFYGPELVGEDSNLLACVFNVKKRSWKAGIQVSVEISANQRSLLSDKLQVSDRLKKNLNALAPHERGHHQERIADLFAQALCWCKLDLRLQTGLTSENQRIPAAELITELDQVASDRQEYVIAYILGELDFEADPSVTL